MDSRTVMRDLVQETADNSFDLWTPEYGLMMDQIQGVEGVTLGDHDFEVWSCFAKWDPLDCIIVCLQAWDTCRLCTVYVHMA